jgi:phage antirepressor YoqD-like protein
LTLANEKPRTIGVAELARQIGTEPTELRKFLRSERRNVGRGSRYEFTAKQASALEGRWKAAHGEPG